MPPAIQNDKMNYTRGIEFNFISNENEYVFRCSKKKRHPVKITMNPPSFPVATKLNHFEGVVNISSIWNRIGTFYNFVYCSYATVFQVCKRNNDFIFPIGRIKIKTLHMLHIGSTYEEVHIEVKIVILHK